MIEPLTQPATTHTDEHDTEPMPAVRITKAGTPETCGVCGKPAAPLIYCQSCHMPLCAKHIEIAIIGGSGRVACPTHKGGE